MSDLRTPTDGKPFYCIYCGCGWNEYGACEDIWCELEAVTVAMARFVAPPPREPQIGNYSQIMNESFDQGRRE